MKKMFFRLLLVFWAGYFINPAISSFPWLGRFGEVILGAVPAFIGFSILFLLTTGLKRLLVQKGAYEPDTERYETFRAIIILLISVGIALYAMCYYSKCIN
jgi:hypothetical protein